MRPLPDWDQLSFAFSATDVFYRCLGREGRDPEWEPGELLPFGPVALNPAAAFFSYGVGVFEGLKAHRARDGRALVFRPRENARRFRRSAERLLMTPFPEERFIAAIEGVVRENLRFLPPHGKGALYLRPLEHAIEPRLGITAGSEFWVLVFGSPVGSYFASDGGVRLKLLEQGRVAAGGTGSVKAIGNYAGGLAVAHHWKLRGFDDVLYLDARHLRYLTETSGSNVFVKLASGPLVTPALDDQILAGVTRDSAIQVAREVLGLTVEERLLPVEEVLDDGEELFCTGTAWTVQHVRELDWRGRILTYGSRELQRALLEEIRGIQLGERADAFGWITEVGS